jgi:hypothetical protein
MNLEHTVIFDTFYEYLLNKHGMDRMNDFWERFCPQCSFDEWKEYCFTTESPF